MNEVISYDEMPLENIKKIIKGNINAMTESAIEIGYCLKNVRERQLYLSEGYSDLWDFAKNEFGISKSSASRYMEINNRFSVNGNSPIIDDNYKDFKKSNLQEMLYLNSDQLEQITSETTVAEIRDIKKKVKVVATSQQEQTDDQVEGQTSIQENFPELIPEDSHNEQWFVKQYFANNQNTLSALMRMCRESKSRSDLAKEFQKYISPYGAYYASHSDHSYSFHGFAGGIDFKIGEEHIHLKYGRLIEEALNLYNPFASTYDLAHTESITQETVPTFKKDGAGYGWTWNQVMTALRQKMQKDEMTTDKFKDGTDECFTYLQTNYIACGFNDGYITIQNDNCESLFKISLERFQEEYEWNKSCSENEKQKEAACDSNCFYCKDESCNCHQEKRTKCIYDSEKCCNLYNAHEVALDLGVNCTSSCCNLCNESGCGARCNHFFFEYANEQQKSENETDVIRESQKPLRPNIKTLMDDPYCPKCDTPLTYRCNCFECGQIINWESVASLFEYEEEQIQNLVNKKAREQLSIIVENPEANNPDNDLELAKKILKNKQSELYNWIEASKDDYTSDDERNINKLKLEVCAFTNYVTNLDNIVNPIPDSEQPELPILKNNEQRKDFIDTYKTWPVWKDIEETGEKYYRYNLTDKVAIVVKVSKKHGYDRVRYKETKDYEFSVEQYYLLGVKFEYGLNGSVFKEDDTRTFYECNTNKTTIVDYLKMFQKKVK